MYFFIKYLDVNNHIRYEELLTLKKNSVIIKVYKNLIKFKRQVHTFINKEAYLILVWYCLKALIFS